MEIHFCFPICGKKAVIVPTCSKHPKCCLPNLNLPLPRPSCTDSKKQVLGDHPSPTPPQSDLTPASGNGQNPGLAKASGLRLGHSSN